MPRRQSNVECILGRQNPMLHLRSDSIALLTSSGASAGAQWPTFCKTLRSYPDAKWLSCASEVDGRST